MSASDHKFVIFRDLKDGYRWRLSSASGETLEYSDRSHIHKGECEQDVYRLKEDRYPHAMVRTRRLGEWHVGLLLAKLIHERRRVWHTLTGISW
jgi:uncharacterized protein YegP (UPF0339 family)